MQQPVFALCLALFLGAATPIAPAALAPKAAAQDADLEHDRELVKDFRSLFRKFKERDTRVEAILALDGVQAVEAVDVLLPILRDDDPEVAYSAMRILAGFERREPIAELFVELEKSSNEVIRAGLLRVIAHGGYRPETEEEHETLAECLEDKSWGVRRRAVEVLAAGGRSEDAQILVGACADPEEAVRCAAFEGLAGMKSQLVLAPALAALEEDSWQVRSCAIFALGEVRSRGSVEPLIDRMDQEQGRLLVDIGRALAKITGRNFRRDPKAWRNYWESVKDRFELPSDEELARTAAARAEEAKFYQGEGGYYGIDTPSKKILFVVDTSASMSILVQNPERFEFPPNQEVSRFEVVQKNLTRAIEELDASVDFNILAFASEVDPWKKRLMPCNTLNRASAIKFVERLKPIGGSKNDPTTLGAGAIVAHANRSGGKTNTWAALAGALGIEGHDVRDEGYKVEVDTVFFLTDGEPSTGEYQEPAEILRVVTDFNALRRITIHTIAIGDFNKDFMMRLAYENGGTYVDLGG